MIEKNSIDIVVVGGGMAGVVAAIAAARRGHSVIIIEKGYSLGGTATSGMVCNFFGMYKGGALFQGGIPAEITNALISKGYGILYKDVPLSSGLDIVVDRVDFNPEYLKILLEEFVEEAHIKVLYGCNIKKINKDKNEIILDISSKYEKAYIFAKFLIDASGNAEAFYMVGSGLSVDSELQPVTLMFKLCDVDKEKYSELTARFIQEKISYGMENKKLPARVLGVSRIPGGSQVVINATREIEINHESIEDITKAMFSTKKQINQIIPYLKENIPGFEHADLAGIACCIGVRHASRIRGIYELKDSDVADGTIFSDGIASCCYPIDIHLKEGGKSYLANIGGKGYYNIPYRCLVVEEHDNMIATGRCISSELAAFASLRIMGTVMAIGEASGIASSLSIENDISIKDISINNLREVLKNNGARLD